jgi:hypothetical protein
MRPSSSCDISRRIVLGIVVSMFAWFLLASGAYMVWTWVVR